MKKSMGTSRVSASRSSVSRTSSGGSSMGRSFGGGGGRVSVGSVRISPFGILVLFAIFVILLVGYVALTTHWSVSLVLLVLSVAGIVINGLVGKPELTPEDKLRESTITEFQIPNSREALRELTLLATQKIEPVTPFAKMFTIEGKRKDWLNKLWAKKCKAIYARASIAMKDDRKNLSEISELISNAGVNVS
jgi:hypothetical protein